MFSIQLLKFSSSNGIVSTGYTINIPCRLRISFLIFGSAVEHWSDAYSCPSSVVHRSSRCSARQANRWFYSSVPCTAIMLFNIAKGSLLDEWALLLLYPANVASFVDRRCSFAAIRVEMKRHFQHTYYFFNVGPLRFPIRIIVENLTFDWLWIFNALAILRLRCNVNLSRKFAQQEQFTSM